VGFHLLFIVIKKWEKLFRKSINMKKIATLICLIIVFSNGFCQSVGIGTNSPASSSILELASGDKGLLIPRMDNPSMRNIAAPAEGLMVYNTTDSSFYTYKTRWRKMSITLPYRDTVSSTVSGIFILQDNSGNGIGAFNRNNGVGIAGFSQGLIFNPSPNSIGVAGTNMNTDNTGVGVRGQHLGIGVGVYGIVLGSDASAVGVKGEAAANGRGVMGIAGNNGYGVYGIAFGSGYGLWGNSNNGTGVWGQTSSGVGVHGFSSTGIAGRFQSLSAIALKTEGQIQLTGIGESPGKVLVSSADGTASWQMVIKQEALTIPGSAFKSTVSSAHYSTADGEIYSAGTSTLYLLTLETPVLLPDSAIVTEITAYVKDLSVTKEIAVVFCKFQNQFFGTTQIGSGILSSGTTGGIAIITVPQSYTIDNNTENYVIRVSITGGDTLWPGNSISLKAVTIKYNYLVNQ
jgi:hypothetical protein